MHYYSFNIGDYASHTRNLSLLEDLAYRRLLDAYYLSEKPFCGDFEDIAREIGMRDHVQEVEYVLCKFFELDNNFWKNKRADEIIAKYHDKKDKSSKAGKASAKQRLNKSSTDVQRTLNQPITNNQEPVNNSVPNGTGDKSPLTPSEIIYSYGLTLLTNAGTPDKQARSFLGGLVKAHGADAVVDKLRACIREKPIQPIEWLAAALPPKGIKSKQQSLEERNRAIADAWQPPEM